MAAGANVCGKAAARCAVAVAMWANDSEEGVAGLDDERDEDA